jgi:hypothetical protein
MASYKVKTPQTLTKDHEEKISRITQRRSGVPKGNEEQDESSENSGRNKPD